MSSILDMNSILWDANGWWGKKLQSPGITKRDWNQTLITQINKCSAQILKENMRGGADVIEVASNLLEIFESLEYYNSDTKQLAGRYKVIFNDNWVNAIKLYKNSVPNVYRTIGVIGLGNFEFDDSPEIKTNKSSDIKTLDFMYLLIR